MAVTSIWPIKSNVRRVIDYARNPEKTVESVPEAMAKLHTIDGVVEYAVDDLKTEARAYVSCINCESEETAADEFMEVKEFWGKTDGRLCFHGYQSFKAGEVNAEMAHNIGVELATLLWGDRFQVVVATHCNTGHYHNHFVLNSVSITDGYHFVNSPADYQAMRELSDELCRKYQLSVVDNPEGRKKNYGEYLAEKAGKTPVHKSIRDDIDRAIAASLTMDEFYAFLEEIGYEFKFYREDGTTLLKYPGLRPHGAAKFARFHRLGSGYQLEDITQRILENSRRRLPFPEAEQDEVREYRAKNQPPRYERNRSPLYKLYLRYCYELHIIEKHPASVQRVSIFLREDVAKLDRLDAETRLMGKHKLSTYEDVTAYKRGLLTKIGELEQQRVELRNEVKRLKRGHELTTAESVIGQKSDITRQLRELRKEVGLCNDILLRSARTREELEWLLDQQEIEEKEEHNDELFRRRGGTGREDELGRH